LSQAVADNSQPPSRRGVYTGGKCNTGDELLGIDRMTHMPVTLEIVAQRSSAPGDVELLRRELMQVRPIAHPNVCRVLDAAPSPWGLVMVTEPRSGQTLHTHIRKRKAQGGGRRSVATLNCGPR